MPYAPHRPCLKCGAPTLNKPAYCDGCTPAIKRRRNAEKKTKPFYGTSAWQGARNRYKAKHPLCEICLSKGEVVPQYYTDHIHEIEDGGARLDVNNFMSLCRTCHTWKTKEMSKRREQGVDAVIAFVDELKEMVLE